MHSKNAILLIAFTAIMILFQPASKAIPADPNAVFDIQQPDGTILSIKPVGDERNGFFTTLDGYTVLKATDNIYYYADIESDGALIPTTVIAHNELDRTTDEIMFISNQAKLIKPSSANRLFPDQKREPILLEKSFLKSEVNAINNVLIILIQFYDYPAIYDSTAFLNLMNQPGYDIYGSANDFYLENSYGQFGINSDVSRWYQAENESISYGYNDGNNWIMAAQLAREAVVWASLNPEIDFSKYDNTGDGQVDGLFIVHAGPGAETGASDFPWSHRWWLSAAGLSPVVTDGVTIDGYTMEPEIHSGTEIARIGVFVHEYGHALGLPDLYDTDGSSSGIGSWGVMSGGSWSGGGKSPSHFCAWSKAELGWITPVNILKDTTDVLIPDASEFPVAYRLWTEGLPSSEYFLVEYRGKTNFDSFIPGCGIAVWHIDDAVGGNSNDAHRLVDLEEADNTENSSAGDVWINKTFSGTTTPNSADYSGDSTRVSVIVTSTACSTGGMTVDFQVGLPPGCCLGMRGNINGDINDEINIEDIVYLVDYSFSSPSGPEPSCLEEADVDGSTDISIADLVYLVAYSFGTPTGPQPVLCP